MIRGKLFLALFIIFLSSACQRTQREQDHSKTGSLQNIPAIKLGFRFEADVPALSIDDDKLQERKSSAKPGRAELFFPAVKEDFERNRPQEVLDETFVSPDGRRVLALYHRPQDAEKQYRLDLYSSDGKLLKTITPDGLAVVYFPDTVAWSPDSKNIAFTGTARLFTSSNQIEQKAVPIPEINNAATQVEDNTLDANISNSNTVSSPTPQNPAEPTPVFRTEQVYICDSDGNNLRQLTQNEGLIHFYIAWSPNSEAILALALTWREWELERLEAQKKAEIFIPSGRPRIIERNGRVRLLDDRKTKVLPVWSPDSSKVAAAFDTEIRIYDAFGDNPTQASIPLKNQLLLASEKYEAQLKEKISNDVSDYGDNNSGVKPLPKEEELVSYNPIINLVWFDQRILYFQTGYVKEMIDTAQSVRSFLRWHRVILSAQG